MSIQRILPEDVETITVETNISRTYISSSISGPTGSAYVFPIRSPSQKEPQPLEIFSSSFFFDTNINDHLRIAKIQALELNNNEGNISQYLEAVSQQAVSARKLQTKEILRFTPDTDLTKDFNVKRTITENLMPFYRVRQPNAHFNFTNYLSLNFFTASTLNNDAVLMYPNPVTASSGILTAPYLPDGAFTFDFWINPKYTTDVPFAAGNSPNFKGGTLLHLSSCYAIHLVTGSKKDVNGFSDGYRLVLQLSTSITNPSRIDLSNPVGLTFVSTDNSLLRNKWHHVSIRWGTNSYNLGSGSFFINDETKGTFVIPSASVKPRTFIPNASNADVLFVGNFYEGANTGSNDIATFFNSTIGTRDGVTVLRNAATDEPALNSFSFNYPLNAEIHDLKIFNKYLISTEINALNSSSLPTKNNLLFYLPPFFTRESPTRTIYNSIGGYLTTPYLATNGTTTTPFLSEMAFGVAGHYINLENHTREFIRGNYPRLYALTASVNNNTTGPSITANEILYASSSIRKASTLILPCDNGRFIPNFEMWLKDKDTASFINDLNNQDYSSISLRNIISTSSIQRNIITDTSTSILAELMGPDPSDTTTIADPAGITYSVLQRTRDNSSNQISFIDISNIYYGLEILPKSIVLRDTNLSCSSGKMNVTLKDDGLGNLYRADCTGSYAAWSSVGNVFYQDGLILIKSPYLYFFGKDYFEIEFKGRQNIHVLSINTYAKSLQQTSSSNPSYLPVSASTMANDTDQKFVYITGIQLHDDNLNVISRTTLAQPIMKRTGEKFKFIIKYDF